MTANSASRHSRKLVIDTAANLLAFVAVKLKGLVMLALVAHLAGADESGVLIQVWVLANLAAHASGLGLFNALIRFSPEAVTRRARRSLFSDLLWPVCGASVACAVVLALLAGPLAELFRSSAHERAFLLGAMLAPAVAIRFLLISWYRAEDRMTRFSQLQGGSELVDLAVTGTAFVVIGTVEAAVAGSVVAATCFAIVLLFVRLRDLGGLTIPSGRVSTYLRYGLPVVPAQLADEALARGDRLIVGAVLGPVMVTVYSAVYAVASLVQTLNAALTNSLFPKLVRAYASDASDATRWLERIAMMYLAVAATIVAILTPFASKIVSALTAGASTGQPVLTIFLLTAAGVLCLGIGRIVSVELYLGFRTGLVAAIWGAAALVNLALNVLLVPLWGIRGAGLATLLSYAVFLAVQLGVSRFRRGRGPVRVASPAESPTVDDGLV